MAPDRGVKKREPKRSGLDLHSKPQMKQQQTKRKKKNGGSEQQKSLGKQIRDLVRMLKRDLPVGNRKALESKVKLLKEQRAAQQLHLQNDRKMVDRYKQVRFFERRKIERRIRRTEKALRAASDAESKAEAVEKLALLKQDLEYVQFFPKTEKYVSLFMKNDDEGAVDRREKLREVIRASVAAAAAAGIELIDDTGSEDYPAPGDEDMSGDDFFLKDSSSDPEASDDDENRGAAKHESRGFNQAISANRQKQNQNHRTEQALEIPESAAPEKDKRKRKRKRPPKKK